MMTCRFPSSKWQQWTFYLYFFYDLINVVLNSLSQNILNIQTHGYLCFVLGFFMVIVVSVQCNGGILPGVILFTLCD